MDTNSTTVELNPSDHAHEESGELSSVAGSTDSSSSQDTIPSESTTPLSGSRLVLKAQTELERENWDTAGNEGALDEEEDLAAEALQGPNLPGIPQPQYPGVNTAESPKATTTFPQLSNNPPASPQSRPIFSADDKDEESSVPRSFDRSAARSLTARHASRKGLFEKDEGFRRMCRFTLYETTIRYYIVGADVSETRFRILKIDRTADIGELSIIEDDVVYTKDEMDSLLSTIEDGNIHIGGLKLRCPFWGWLGFIRFTGTYYMLLVTKRSVVAMIGGHYIYQIGATELVPIMPINTTKKADHNPEEARFVSILGNLDLTRSFYFSYSYDVTHTLQYNITREREALAKGIYHPGIHEHNDMFVWNHYLLQPACLHIRNIFDWCLPIIHGYVDQATISVYGRVVYITIIARRSRHFAGARFLKRGANDLGYVANDVETEQIVSDMVTTSFHAPGNRLFANPNYTSYVQHRGSIPLFWTQESTAATPKPPIEMNLVDPFFSAAALHFDNMFHRYGAPIVVLNLVKSKERTPRESILLKEYEQAIRYLNQFLPEAAKIHYKAFDMSRASNSRDQDVIQILEDKAEEVLEKTGFFQNGFSPENPAKMQDGVCRTNCIDCLDRTNAAQFVVGKRALGRQLQALGVIKENTVEYDTDAVNLFTHMYHDHGDTIAVQYAGSHLVNTMETYRKINQWSSQPRDMLESLKRYYTSSFLDAQRQEAINLFLGNYIFTQGQPMLWDLTTDYYLHHADPRKGKRRRNYTKWWTPKNLQKRIIPELPTVANSDISLVDDYWTEYYRPRALSSFAKVFSYSLNSAFKYIPIKMTQEGKYDLSPFKVRVSHADSVTGDPRDNSRNKRKRRKSIKLIASGGVDADLDEEIEENDDQSINTRQRRLSETSAIGNLTAEGQLKRISLQNIPPGWVSAAHNQQCQPNSFDSDVAAGYLRHGSAGSSGMMSRSVLGGFASPTKSGMLPVGKLPLAQLPIDEAVGRLLNPTVSDLDAIEYERYMSHPLNLPLVVSTDAPDITSILHLNNDNYLNNNHRYHHNPSSIREFVHYVASTAPEPIFPSISSSTSTSINHVPNLASSYYRPDDKDLAIYEQFLNVPENALGVDVNDGQKKRYKAYQVWLNTGKLKGPGVGQAHRTHEMTVDVHEARINSQVGARGLGAKVNAASGRRDSTAGLGLGGLGFSLSGLSGKVY